MSKEYGKELDKPNNSTMNLNNIATVGAVILSIIAIVISVLEVSTMRTQQKASVWPYLQLDTTYSVDKFRIHLNNKGIGPALIKDIQLKVDGVNANSIDESIIKLVGKENAFSYNIYRVSNPANSVISANESIRLFSVPLSLEKEGIVSSYKPGLLFAQQTNTRLDIEICYCSIFDDCWTSSMQKSGVEEVNFCP